MIHIGIGPYLMKSKIYEINEKGGILFIEEMIEKNVIMPKDYKQIPDVILYFLSEDREDGRMSYCRVKAKDIIIEDG